LWFSQKGSHSKCKLNYYFSSIKNFFPQENNQVNKNPHCIDLKNVVSKQHGYYSIVLRIYINKKAVGIGQITLVYMATCALENKYGNWPICLGHMRLECNPVSVLAKHKVGWMKIIGDFLDLKANFLI